MVECPVCRTSNPPGSLCCVKCSTPIELDGATIAFHPADHPRDEAATIIHDTRAHITTAQDDGAGETRAGYDADATIAGATGWTDPVPQSGPTDPRAALEAGMVLGERYEILKPLGEGGMGAVYKARDRELDRLVALKVIRPELAGHPEILRRFKRELILARQITHKNVIRIFDLGMADGRKFITMDFIDGRDLKSILVERNKLPPSEAVPLMQQICRGLGAAHAEGVVHRDLKPQNIMVDAAGRVWVMDFGLARSMEMAGMTRTGALMGTPDYMSPEQARAQKVDARSDLFSLGLIFHEMLTGQLPFQADTMMATLLKRVNEKATPPFVLDSAIPRHLSDMVMKCLEVDVAKRYQTAEEMLADMGADGSATMASMAPAPAISLAGLGPGAQFGPRYTIESIIGEGGMGKVYKAHDHDLDRTVALKLVRQELAGDPNSMLRFKQELQLASRISHKNILRIHDLGDVGGVKFISMAFVEGKDLHDVIAESGRLSIDRCIHIARQLASALEAAHSEGVVHRDLKPRNVLVDKNDIVCVSDFGLAKSLQTEEATLMTRVGEILGTPRYMSPEQAESKPADNRSDIYSLGVILYEMATGDAPFAGESSMQVMFQHVTQQPKNPQELNPELPDYFAQIILRCLEKDPAARYQNATEILRDLETAQPADRIVRLRIAETGYPKWLVAPMAALVLLVAATLAIPSWRNAVLGRVGGVAQRAAGLALSKDKYLAVLPFRVLGEDATLKYTADGVADAISAKLFQSKNIYVATGSAVEQASKKGSLDKIARDLGVNLLVQGTVQSAGPSISIVVSVDDKNGQRLWSKLFKGLREDLLTLEDSIYTELVTALNVKPTDEDLARGATRLTANYSAYELYLKARSILRSRPDVKSLNAALSFFDQATQKDPRFALAYAGMAETSLSIYEETKDAPWSQKALSAALQAQQLKPDLVEVHYALGTVYLKTGKSNEAIEELKQAVALVPNSDEGYRRLGTAYMEAGRKDESLAAYQKAVEINPYFWFNHNRLGMAFARFGDNDKALGEFRRVTELSPDWGPGYSNVGFIYVQQDRWNDSISEFQKSIALEPSDTAYSNLGVAYYYLGRYADAAKTLEKAIEMDPNGHQAEANLADAYRELGQRDKAMATYETAINLAMKEYQVNPRDAGTVGALGLYYGKKGDLNRADEFIRRARSIDSHDNTLIYDEALIQALSGKSAEAFKGLREAFQKGYSIEIARHEPELATLRSSPEFQKLVDEFSRKK